ncbi:NAD(P)H-binding protein [uncultured Roseobacter sp.]|uniref:NmrA family NAD(P)-binding protein n=1 Tax=uncultured Roseobacter sp. TaxID=114847 RepID=UPI002622581D|nr:NAD(P)H-binding protein [uncultured Roseobacter sp.]
MILVTTPTGDISARVLEHLLNAKASVRVVVRDANKLSKSVAEQVEVIEGSHADAAVIGRALDGADRVFWLPPGSPVAPDAHAAYVTFSRPFIEALPGSGVSHVVGISALGRGWPGPAGLVTASLAMDDLIGRTGVAYRALCCASLMDNLMRQLDAIRGGALYVPAPADRAMPLVAKADVAAEASRLLFSDWNGVAEVPMPGPEDLSHNEMAAILTEVLRQPIAFHEIPVPAFAEMLRGMGASEGMVHDYAAMMAAKATGLDEMVPSASRKASPTTFRSWAEAELRPALA